MKGDEPIGHEKARSVAGCRAQIALLVIRLTVLDKSQAVVFAQDVERKP